MSDLQIYVLGVGDTFSEKHHGTSVVLVCDGVHLAIDCPDTYRGVLRDFGARAGRSVHLEQIDHFLVTHVHGDHINGLEGVAFYKHFAERKRVSLVCSPELRDVLWDERLKASMSSLWDGAAFRALGFDDYFEHHELPFGQSVTIGPFRITTRRTVHHVPTSALFVEAGGHTLGYSSDTAFDPSLIDFLAPAELVIHETNLGPAHTAYADLLTLPAALRDKMRLIHYSDLFDPDTSAIRCLREGEIIRMG